MDVFARETGGAPELNEGTVSAPIQTKTVGELIVCVIDALPQDCQRHVTKRVPKIYLMQYRGSITHPPWGRRDYACELG